MRTRTETLRMLRMIIIAFALLIIAGYAIWRSLNYAKGPEILIFEPTSGATVASSTVTIRGKAERINNITLNGSPISIDQQGNFEEIVALFPGTNNMLIEAEDRFKRKIAKKLIIFGSAELPTKRILDEDILNTR